MTNLGQGAFCRESKLLKKSCPGLVAVLIFAMGATIDISAQSEKIDQYIRAEMEIRRIPGLALVVIKNGEIVKLNGYGVANLEHDVSVTPDTVFELASVTKQFTATAIMLLMEEGKVRLDDSISHYLSGSPSRWKSITVRHLLTHTAGLPGLENGFKALQEGGVRTDYSTAMLFEAATKDSLDFSPGERWQYSDIGYFLLGMIIEKASGRRYQDFLAERFFKPLGMESTSVLDQWAIVKNRAAGYSIRNGKLINIRRVAQVELPSHYGVFSTVRDLAKWEIALASGKVVKKSSLAAMWTRVKLNNGRSYPYGFGWEVRSKFGHRIIDHAGITGTEYARYPDDNLTVIVLTNLGKQSVDTKDVRPWGLTKGVARFFIPGLFFWGSWFPWWIVAAVICLVMALATFRIRQIPRWFGYFSGASAVVFILGMAALALRSASWVVAPVGIVFLLWLVVAGAVLARKMKTFSRLADKQASHSSV